MLWRLKDSLSGYETILTIIFLLPLEDLSSFICFYWQTVCYQSSCHSFVKIHLFSPRTLKIFFYLIFYDFTLLYLRCIYLSYLIRSAHVFLQFWNILRQYLFKYYFSAKASFLFFYSGNSYINMLAFPNLLAVLLPALSSSFTLDLSVICSGELFSVIFQKRW